MQLAHLNIFAAMWLAWMLYWLLAAARTKQTARRESHASRISHVLPLAIAAVLLGTPKVPIAGFSARLLPFPLAAYWAGAFITACGLLFTVWARVHLAGNWSGTVTIKQGHELIQTGPYAYVRHPIYSGLLFAFAGSALGRNDVRGLVALAIAIVALWRKLRIEEQWLTQEFGPAYEAYRRRARPDPLRRLIVASGSPATMRREPGCV